MSNKIGISLNEIVTYIAIFVWISFGFWNVVNLFKKDYVAFKKTILYFVNSLVFLVGVPFYVRLAIIVQGPKEATKEASMRVLTYDCLFEFVSYFIVSILATAILLGINFLFQKYILKKIEKKALITLAILDFSILLLLTALAIFNYYISISGEIDAYLH